MKKIGSVIEKIYFGIGAAAMGLLAVLVIFTVIMRYCFSLSWKSVSEFNVVLFAFTTFWGLGLNVLKNEHVSINILYDKFKPAVKRWISLFNYLVMLVVDFLFVRYSWQYTAKMGKQMAKVLIKDGDTVCGVICILCILLKMFETARAPLSEFEAKDIPLDQMHD